MPTIELQLPAPHPAQERIIREAKRFGVLACGRRFGKNILAMDRLVKPALAGQPCAWFGPNYRLLSETWRDLLKMLQPVIVTKSETEKRIELLGGGSIDCWSLDSPDAARGRRYATVVLDECAMIPDLEIAWQQSIRP